MLQLEMAEHYCCGLEIQRHTTVLCQKKCKHGKKYIFLKMVLLVDLVYSCILHAEFKCMHELLLGLFSDFTAQLQQ